MVRKISNRQVRSLNINFNNDISSKRLVTDYYVAGYATTFNDRYEMYKIDGISYYEQIDNRALDNANMSNIIMLYDHEGRVLARQSNNTLIVEQHADGLFVCADLSKSDYARSLYEDVKNGLINSMSWSFSVNEWSWDRNTRTDTVKQIDTVYDVALVSIPANENTSVNARKKAILKQEGIELRKKKLILNLDLTEDLEDE